MWKPAVLFDEFPLDPGFASGALPERGEVGVGSHACLHDLPVATERAAPPPVRARQQTLDPDH